MGEAARDSIAWGLDAYAARFEGLAGFGFGEAVDRARAYLRPAEDYTPQALEQLRGMAEAAKVPFEQLFALNCSEEFTCRADANWPPEHCTSFAVVAGGRPVAGHNEDWYPEEIEAQTVRVVRVKGRWSAAAYISAGPAYNLPITGVTAAGYSSAANTVYYRDERAGVPNNLLLATVLCQPDLEHARDVIAAAPRARGSNHLLCDARGRVWDLETSGERWAFLDGSPPPPEAASFGATALFAHTNHYVSPELAPGDASRSEGSRLRRERAERLLLEGLEVGDRPGRAGQARALRPRERAVQHLRPLGGRRPGPRPERDHGEHGVGAGRGPRPHRRRPALRVGVRDVRALRSEPDPSASIPDEVDRRRLAL